jgi:hypothetical protein
MAKDDPLGWKSIIYSGFAVEGDTVDLIGFIG